jgi:hypothetical protein
MKNLNLLWEEEKGPEEVRSNSRKLDRTLENSEKLKYSCGKFIKN